jgi:hypothetical protein
MANQIAANVGACLDESAAAHRTADHIRRFWPPAMREQLLVHYRQDGEGLSPVVRLALETLSS